MLTAVFVLSLLLAFAAAQESEDVCQKVLLMSEYCVSQGANSTTGGLVNYEYLDQQINIRLQEMEARLIKKFGEPPEVNYTLMEQNIEIRFKDVEARVIAQLGEPPKVNYTMIDINIDERFKRLEALVNGNADEGSIVDYNFIQQKIDVKFTEIRAYVDAKFALLLNNSDDYEQAVDEMNRRKNITECRKVRLGDAKLCNATGGVYDIYRGDKIYEVFCDTFTDGGGWTVFQRRMDGSTYFNRTWNEYVDGFGDRAREFWIGLRTLHELLQDGTHELRIDLMNANGYVRFAKYKLFYVSGSASDYTILLQSFSGDLPNSQTSGLKFSTFDRDNDGSNYNCAERQLGGWWYNGDYRCGNSALNGMYNTDKLLWNGFGSIVKAEMKFRKLPEDD